MKRNTSIFNSKTRNCIMTKTTESIIREWLAEYKSLAESSIPNYAEEIKQRDDIQIALMDLFKLCSDESNSSRSLTDLLQPVCHQLFEFYKSRLKELKYFTINLFPAIILSHIVSNSFTIDSNTAPIDTLILSIFALENVHKPGADSPGLEIPQLVNPSIYHDPLKGVFADRVVHVQNPGRRFFQKPVLPEYDDIIPSNRYQILNRLLTTYCEHIAIMKKISHISLCRACTFLASCGFPWRTKYINKNEGEEISIRTKRRYPVGVEFIMTLLRGVYFALYNECWDEGFVAVESMQRRARRELISQVLFLSNAIMNSAQTEAKDRRISGNTENVPFGLSSATLTPLLARENSRRGANRTAVTAKSIRVHKWRHNNEVISGDLSRSLENTETHPIKSVPSIVTDDDHVKFDKHATSPSKLLKSKLKKSGVTDKTKSPMPSSGDKKHQPSDVVAEKIDSDKVKNSPSQKWENPSKKSPLFARKSSKSSMIKQPSLDEITVHSTGSKLKGSSFVKSTSDPVGPMLTGRSPASLIDTSYNPNEPSPKHNTSVSPLLETSRLDSSNSGDSEVEGHNLSNGDKSKESIPLLPTSESNAQKSQTGTQQTVF